MKLSYLSVHHHFFCSFHSALVQVERVLSISLNLRIILSLSGNPNPYQIFLLPGYVDPAQLLVFRLDVRTDSDLFGQKGDVAGLSERLNDVHVVVSIHLGVCLFVVQI